MNKKDLDALKELYSSVYDEEQLNERAPFGLNPLDLLPANSPDAVRQRKRLGQEGQAQRERDRVARATQQRRDLGVERSGPDKKGPYVFNDLTAYDGDKSAQAVGLVDRLNKEGGLGKYGKNKAQPAAVRPTKPTPATTPVAARPTGSGSTPPPRPAARPSGPVLSKKNGVEGTGVGANFKARAFSAAEKSRYSSVAAQNAAKSSASSGTPKPSSPTPAASAPKPAIGMLGKTSFERRTPTSAELSAAQSAPKGSTPEQRLQAAKNVGVVSKPATPGSNSINSTKKQMTPGPVTQSNSYEWPSAKTIRDIAGAYASIYEAKSKEVDPSRDKDGDGDNDFADNMVARMVASGMSREEAIKKVKNKEYNREEFELVDEATRMGKELGKEGETATRKELAARSNAYQRSGSVDKTIAAAERRAERPYVKPVRDENESDYNKRLQKSSDTMSKLAASRRGSVRDKPRAGLRGYAADVKGSDKELQSSRRSAMAAGTLTPREKKMLNKEAYETYEFVASYLLENNFASTVEDANVIINNMSENWFESIIEEKKPLPVAKMKRKEEKLDRELESELPKALRTEIDSPERKELLRKNRRFGDMHDVRRSVSTRGGKRPLQMPEVGRYKPKDED